ncbi:hypothetical protein KY362_01580 [Candidatus Woesearchaeota archaeon]|nr:hypothetical protein [Candidatus Woesearchaeota archaeon]
MKSIVVYYSRTGNTRKVGMEIAKQLGCDAEELKDTVDRSGAMGYMKAGRDAMSRRMTKIRIVQHEPKNYDLVIIGTPIWGWNMTPAVRTYLSQNSGTFKDVAFYCTMGGSGDTRAFKEMERLCRKRPLGKIALIDKQLNGPGTPAKIKDFLAFVKNNKGKKGE